MFYNINLLNHNKTRKDNAISMDFNTDMASLFKKDKLINSFQISFS